MNWSNFWDLFSVSIHDKRELSDAEKLAYLRDALKDGPAGAVIRGLVKIGFLWPGHSSAGVSRCYN